ncbi:MAG: putative protein YqjZ [Pseudomonas sp.]|nr:MAG: putative protein YqjZ [Pseudomonas sp.]
MSELPTPPYYAVIFTSRRSALEDGYAETAQRMLELASAQPGYLGVESARGEDGLGITVSYWRDEQAIRQWREQLEHRSARQRGREDWYRYFTVRVARVERSYGFGDHA